MPRKKIVSRVRSTKVNLWMRPELIDKVSKIAEERGLSRDGAFESGMNEWVSTKVKETNDKRKH